VKFLVTSMASRFVWSCWII